MSIRPGATAAMVGGALWALLPAAWSIDSGQVPSRGTLAFLASVLVTWVFAALAPALLLIALRGSAAALRPGPCVWPPQPCAGLVWSGS
jgi:hypothetical protein